MTDAKELPLKGRIKIRSSQSLLDGLIGTAAIDPKTQLLIMQLTEDAPQADLEVADQIRIPLISITFIQDLDN